MTSLCFLISYLRSQANGFDLLYPSTHTHTLPPTPLPMAELLTRDILIYLGLELRRQRFFSLCWCLRLPAAVAVITLLQRRLTAAGGGGGGPMSSSRSVPHRVSVSAAGTRFVSCCKSRLLTLLLKHQKT